MVKNVNGFVFDIGGTNIRGAVAYDDGTYGASYKMALAEFSTIQEGLLGVIREIKQEHPGFLNIPVKNIGIGIACPVASDYIQMTNANFGFSIAQMKQDLALEKLRVRNDFWTITNSLQALTLNQLETIYQPQQIAKNHQNDIHLVGGGGTGLGFGVLVNGQVIPTEFGHMIVAPEGDEEKKIFDEILWIKNAKNQKSGKIYRYVAAEDLGSGSGLPNAYNAILNVKAPQENYTRPDILPATITALATGQILGSTLDKVEGGLTGLDQVDAAKQAMLLFTKAQAQVFRNLALMGPNGMYMAGGIISQPGVKQLMIENHDFVELVHGASDHRNVVNKTPIHIITESNPGLIGSALDLRM